MLAENTETYVGVAPRGHRADTEIICSVYRQLALTDVSMNAAVTATTTRVQNC